MAAAKEQAAQAYDRAARELRPGKAPLNYKSAEEAAAAVALAETALVALAQAEAEHRRSAVVLPLSGFYGVRASGKKWEATLRYYRHQKYLGMS